MAQKKGEIVVGLDIGTTKICCIVGEVSPDGIDVIGIGTHPSRGLRKGVVINIEATVSSIHKAVEEAELMAGAEISAVYAGIAGGHIRGFNSQGVVAVKDKEVKQGDLERVLDAARAINIPQDREILHVLPQEYIIDEQDGIREPLGMSGVRLEAKVHIVTAAVSSAQNIVSAAGGPGWRWRTSCWSRSRRRRPCWRKRRRSWASRWSTSAAAPRTWPSSRGASSSTRA